jgi:hypothetical protein
MNIQQGDIDILKTVAEYTFVQSSQIVRLTGRASKVEGWETQLVNRRLRALRAAGLLRRFSLPHLSESNVNAGEFVHMLTRRGARDLNTLGVEDAPEAWAPETTSNLYLPHQMLVTDFHIALKAALAASGCRLVDWSRRPKEIADRFTDGSVNPDAFFGIENPAKPEDERYSYYFLEVERSRQKVKKGKTALEEKFDNYLAYQQGAFQARWGTPTFRVLSVFMTQERLQHFLDRVEPDSSLAKAKFLYSTVGSDPLTWTTKQDGVRSLIA